MVLSSLLTNTVGRFEGWERHIWTLSAWHTSVRLGDACILHFWRHVRNPGVGTAANAAACGDEDDGGVWSGGEEVKVVEFSSKKRLFS